MRASVYRDSAEPPLGFGAALSLTKRGASDLARRACAEAFLDVEPPHRDKRDCLLNRREAYQWMMRDSATLRGD